MWFFQASFGIPAEGVYTALVAILLIVIAALLIVVWMMAARNIRLSDDNRQITRDAIKGFQDVIAALNAIREQLQAGDNALMGKMNDTHSHVTEKIRSLREEILAHLQYLRDKSR